jgi:hypothetical protein
MDISVGETGGSLRGRFVDSSREVTARESFFKRQARVSKQFFIEPLRQAQRWRARAPVFFAGAQNCGR